MAEQNSLGGRVRRYAKVGAGVGGLAVKMAGSRALGIDLDRGANAAELKAALGGLKGPLMKVAQLLATIPDALPPEYATELAGLQTNAPAMGWPFVKRRMIAELGSGWQSRFSSFDRNAAAAASLGQVHRATIGDADDLALKLQYPDMASAVEADLGQLDMIFSLYRRMNSAIDTREIHKEIGDRLREELDYDLERRHMDLYRIMMAGEPLVAIPRALGELCTPRLLAMSWMDGEPLLEFRGAGLETRNTIARSMFHAWWHPFAHYGAIHGDPHLGNYKVRGDHGINLLDFGCIRTFRPGFVEGVINLYRAIRADDRKGTVAAYETWGFRDLTDELVETLNIWAGFIYGPMLDDRVRTIADGIEPSLYGRREAGQVYQRLKELGPITPPREFVFMDRAAIGLGSVFLHLRAELNWHDMFNAEIEGFDAAEFTLRQKDTFARANVPLPAG